MSQYTWVYRGVIKHAHWNDADRELYLETPPQAMVLAMERNKETGRGGIQTLSAESLYVSVHERPATAAERPISV